MADAPILNLDLETYATADLKRVGTYRYAQDHQTGVWIGCYAFGQEAVETWHAGQPCPPRIVDHIKSGGTISAWHAQFERLMIESVLGPRHGWPVPKLRQFHCTAAQAAVLSLPRSLDGAAAALRLNLRKDPEGHQNMLRCCRPRHWLLPDGAISVKRVDGAEPVWWLPDDRGKRDKLVARCVLDVEMERRIGQTLRPLSPSERIVYLLDQRINSRGARLDLPLIAAAQRIVVDATVDLDRRMREMTGGAVPKCTNVAKLTAWLIGRGVDMPTKPATKDELDKLEEAAETLALTADMEEAAEEAADLLAERRKGKPSLAKAAMRKLLAKTDLPDDCKGAVEIRAEAAKSSTAKLTAMEKAVCDDQRLRGAFLYAGTGPGRWTGKLVQPANLTKGDPEIVERAALAVRDVMTGEHERVKILWGSSLNVISSLLRGCFIAAPRKKLLVADYTAIQARIVPWGAGEQWKLDMFRAYDAGTGPDAYKVAAAKIYGVPVGAVTKEQRQVGKVSELAFSFGGGLNAFHAMAAIYDLSLPDDEVQESKKAWRLANAATADYETGLWRQMEDAAFEAVRRPGLTTSAARGLVRFKVSGDWLYMILPSGRPIAYAYPTIKDTLRPWGDMLPSVCFWGVHPITKQWAPLSTYGGKLTENFAMGVERDLLVGAMIRLENAGYPIVLHNYDETVCEVDEDFGSVDEVVRLMTQGESWSTGLPIAAAGASLNRYTKL